MLFHICRPVDLESAQYSKHEFRLLSRDASRHESVNQRCTSLEPQREHKALNVTLSPSILCDGFQIVHSILQNCIRCPWTQRNGAGIIELGNWLRPCVSLRPASIWCNNHRMSTGNVSPGFLSLYFARYKLALPATCFLGCILHFSLLNPSHLQVLKDNLGGR